MFRNRKEAGEQLAEFLREKEADFDLVLGIPRGGVVVAYPIAQKYGCPLDVVIARKIGSPSDPEYAIGAVTPDGEILVDENLLMFLHLDKNQFEQAAKHVHQEINWRLTAYRGGRPALSMEGKRVLLVDDGIATGFTVRAAIAYLRRQGASYIAVATPVAAPDTYSSLKRLADDVFCLHVPSVFYAVGQFYEDFSATSDQEVISLLQAI
ncbi:MAG: phosphoribosyltransferase [Syntrophothermus sp.]|uniref:phosphoribosyltransferase n=1 Tax=Syntrophothermus sp. TaxID=2736299 RepID=UPI00257B5DF2|nr:phosphoribosyltransferase family protein [Syntrophothermus sp.]NSW83844.1 phosphoribosyltransferase [Syntrophothermus sp.]